MKELDKIETHLVYRTLGNRSPNERLGVGFMHKRPHSTDDTSDHYSLVYVLRGSGSYCDANGTRRLDAGSVFQRVPNHKHTTTTGDDWFECFLALPAAIFDSMHALGLLPGDPHVRNIGVNSALIVQFQELRAELQGAPERLLPTLMGRIITLLTDTLAGAHDDRDTQMVEDACQVLGMDLANRISIPALCETYGWGYERFRKVFFEHLGVSPGQYRIRRRIDAACELLHNRDLSIGEIAEKLGYPSPYEFSGQFKKQTGKSPSHYRKRG